MYESFLYFPTNYVEDLCNQYIEINYILLNEAIYLFPSFFSFLNVLLFLNVILLFTIKLHVNRLHK